MTQPEPSRRDFLRVGAAGAAATLASPLFGAGPTPPTACIQILLVGGPSQLDTWDPKPDAPTDVRGPFRPIRTSVPGLCFSELFPRLAQNAHRFAVVRSLHHREAPIHETGQQLLQTGLLHAGRAEWYHFGAAVSQAAPGTPAEGLRPWVVLPGPLGDTGVDVSHGQGAGVLGDNYGPQYFRYDLDAHPALHLACEPDTLRERYGNSQFARCCLWARRLVERGVRVVTVNMYDTVFGRVTWDCHAAGGELSTTLADYARQVCPDFDRAFAALLDDLDERGLLATTLVTAAGEFGRTPKLNDRGGRDHWPGVWSGLIAGGGVRGGRVVGASDRLGAVPADRPVPAAELYALATEHLLPGVRTTLSELF
jgi:uncharacterized protein (DUF1501 family)